MPTYDYGCTVCGRMVEVMHGVHGTGPQRCEACGGALRKLISAPAVHFKGSGWAGKDARDSGRSRSAAGSANETKTSANATKSSGDDSKPSGDEAKSSGDEAKSSPGAGGKAPVGPSPASSGAGEAP